MSIKIKWSIIEKIVRKYGYIKKDEIREYLIKAQDTARLKERERCTLEKDEAIQMIKDQMTIEASMVESELTSENNMLQREIISMKKQVEDARNVYYSCWKQIKSNLKVSAESRLQMQKLNSNIQEIYQSIISIGSEAEEQNEKMLESDTQFRKKLNMENLK